MLRGRETYMIPPKKYNKVSSITYRGEKSGSLEFHIFSSFPNFTFSFKGKEFREVFKCTKKKLSQQWSWTLVTGRKLQNFREVCVK